MSEPRYVLCEACGFYTLPTCFACGRMVGAAQAELMQAAEAPGPAGSRTAASADRTASGAQRTRPPRRAAEPRSTSKLVLVGVLLGLAALGASVLTDRTSLLSDRSPSRSSSGQFEAPQSAASMQTFSGSQFTVLYPMGWVVERAETAPEGVEYLDTTIRRADGDPHFLIRVDVAQAETDPVGTAGEVVASLRGEPGFRQVSYQSTTVGLQNGSSVPAIFLEFLLTHPDTGVLMHSVDIFFQASGRGYALLTRAPDDQWSAWRDAFELVRGSISVPG